MLKVHFFNHKYSYALGRQIYKLLRIINKHATRTVQSAISQNQSRHIIVGKLSF